MRTLPPNPYFAFVKLNVGEFNMTQVPPEHLVQFTYTRKPLNSANKFIISLFDETAMLVEYQLLKGYKEIKFQYGYVNGVVSPVYSGMVTEYDVDFTSAGAVLNIEGLSSSISSFSKAVTKTYSGMRIHEIVKAIAKEEGWIEGNIVACQPVSDGDNKNKTFTRNNQAAQIFITNELIPYAKSAKNGDSNYVLNFEDTAEGTKVNFYPIIQAGKQDDPSAAITDYEFQWGSGERNSKVISFNPDYSGTLSLMSGGATVEADTVDKIANEMFSIKYDNNTDSNRTTLGSKAPYDYAGAVRKIGGSSYTMDEMKNIAAYMWYSHSTYPVTAELVVLGDPNLNAFDMVSIVMLNKDGLPHHSSGVYLIKEIEDDISAGLFQSKMTLFRNAMEVGIDASGGVNVTISSTYPSTTAGSGGADGSSNSGIAGTSTSSIVNVAMGQKGNKGGEKFWSWWGYSYRVAWCAIFVSWCAEQAGIPRNVIPKYQGCTDGVSQFNKLGRWRDASYTPQAGDIIFFDSPSNSGHTGIVVRCDGTTVYTIEGNTSDMVAERSYNKAHPSRAIAGYGYTGQL